jgi:hypothetical protein
MKNAENRLRNIASLLKSADRNLKKAHRLLDALREDMSSSYDDIPGTLGVFDGTHMVTPDGKKYEVNPNYAAKSLLVPGDNLKMVEDKDGTLLFKQVSKVNRKRLEGILNKKEGKWYALTDAGSYRILDVAVEFRDGEVNDELTVLVPEDDLKVEYAALEKMAKEVAAEEDEGDKDSVEKEKPKKEKGKEEKKEEKKPVRKPAKEKTTRKTTPRKAVKRKPRRRMKEKEPEGMTPEEVDSLLDEDDLR